MDNKDNIPNQLAPLCNYEDVKDIGDFSFREKV